jgi:hypothetical protein
MHHISRSFISLVMPFWLCMYVYVGHIKSRFCNPLPCCKFYLTKHHHIIIYLPQFNQNKISTFIMFSSFFVNSLLPAKFAVITSACPYLKSFFGRMYTGYTKLVNLCIELTKLFLQCFSLSLHYKFNKNIYIYLLRHILLLYPILIFIFYTILQILL